MRGKGLIAGVVAAVVLPIAAWLALVEAYRPAVTAGSPVPTAGKLYVANAFGDDVQVFDLASSQLVARIKTGKLPHNLLALPDRTLFVTEAGAQAVGRIGTRADMMVQERVVGEVPGNPAHFAAGMATVQQASNCTQCHPGKVLGSMPAAIAPFPDDERLVVTELKARDLVVLDRHTLDTRRTVAIANPTPSAPSNVIFHPVTHEAYVLCRELAEAAPPHPARRRGHRLDEQLSAADFEHDPGPGSSWLVVYDPELKAPRWRLKLPYAGAFAAQFSPDAATLYVACRGAAQVLVIDVAKRAVQRELAVAANPVGMLLLPDGLLAVAGYGAKPSVLQFVDPKSGKVVRSLDVPDNPTQLARHPGTGKLYVAISGANEVDEVDPAMATVTRRFQTGAAPVGVAVIP